MHSQSIQCRSQCTVTAVYSQSTESTIQSSNTVRHTVSQYSAPYSQPIQCTIQSASTVHLTVNKYKASYSQSIQSIIHSQPIQSIIQSAVCRQAVIRYSVAYMNTVIKSDLPTATKYVNVNTLHSFTAWMLKVTAGVTVNHTNKLQPVSPRAALLVLVPFDRLQTDSYLFHV